MPALQSMLLEVWHVVTLQDFNTRVVVLGTMLLGMASGVVGSFMFLRKRSLAGDAASHATLPGIGIAFLLMVYHGGSGKYLPGLLLGALISGCLGMMVIMFIRRATRLNEDAALGIVLSVFFGLGIAVLGIIQKMNKGHAAGLESFIYGKTASMLIGDMYLIGLAAVVVIFVCVLMMKELTLLCFDQEYADAAGFRSFLLDAVIMFLVVGVSVIGLQAVGLILMVAFLIIPPAAARFWTHRVWRLCLIAAVFGAVSGAAGAAISALAPRLPAGAIIVSVAGAIFFFSMLVGTDRGVIPRTVELRRLKRKVGRDHLLRAVFEAGERDGKTRPVTIKELLTQRTWSRFRLLSILHRLARKGLVAGTAIDGYRLTEEGWAEARRVVRNHRLWECYLITHADIAPSHVDRDADQIEHVLGKAMVEKLEKLVADRALESTVPPSPHEITCLPEAGR